MLLLPWYFVSIIRANVFPIFDTFYSLDMSFYISWFMVYVLFFLTSLDEKELLRHLSLSFLFVQRRRIEMRTWSSHEDLTSCLGLDAVRGAEGLPAIAYYPTGQAVLPRDPASSGVCLRRKSTPMRITRKRFYSQSKRFRRIWIWEGRNRQLGLQGLNGHKVPVTPAGTGLEAR